MEGRLPGARGVWSPHRRLEAAAPSAHSGQRQLGDALHFCPNRDLVLGIVPGFWDGWGSAHGAGKTMSLWEYKVITSGKGGFATPALLEKFLNDLGRDEWEIIHYQTPPDNFMAFTGLARRSTQRDWTLQDAAAAAAKAEAEKLRAEFEAKFKAASTPAPAGAEERTPSFLEEKSAPDDGLRKLVDTSHDDDPEAQEDDKADEWDKLAAAEEDELPTFFEAMRPHMRRNQRGPGMSVGVDYLAKKWDQSEDDLKGALAECGFVVPADEDTPVDYLEYDGDLFWLNINRRGELWINTKEKPRPVFRPVKAVRVEVEAPKPESVAPKTEAGTAPAGEAVPAAEAGEGKPEGQTPAPEIIRSPSAALPEGAALLAKIRPHMRRNRRGPGGSGSMTFLSRALRTKEADLKAALVALGLTAPTTTGDKPVFSEIGDEFWWLNLDSRGGLWINGREKKQGETASSLAAEDTPVTAPSGDAPAAMPGEAPASPALVATEAGTDAPSTSPSAPDSTLTPAPDSTLTPAPNSPAPNSTLTPGLEATAVPAVVIAVVDLTPVPADTPTSDSAIATSPAPAEATAAILAPAEGSPLAAMRRLLKETRTGAFAGKIDRIAEELGQSPDNVVATLVATGLKIPEKAREKPMFIEHTGELLWFSKNAKGELWINAKASKLPDKDVSAEAPEDENDGESGESGEGNGIEDDGEKKSVRRGPRSRPKKADSSPGM